MADRSFSDEAPKTSWLETLGAIASALGPGRSFQANLSLILNLLKERHSFIRPHLVLFEPETGLLKLSLADPAHVAHDASYKPGVGVTGRVFATGQPVIVEKMKGHPLFSSLLFDRSDEELERLAFISVPILSSLSANPYDSRDVIGTLNADTPGGDRKELDWRKSFLEVVASMIAGEAAHLQDELSEGEAMPVRYDENEKEDAPFIAQSKVMRHILEQIAHLAQGRFPVLLRGEPGTGKERLARRLHASSQRRAVPMVVCYLGGLSPEKMEADLFGYQKGAFPGAARTYKGLFEQANKGSLFLDGVEHLTPRAQQALLELISERRVRRLGADAAVVSDARVIASSGVQLEALVRSGAFSEELFARLNVCSLNIPPLRERREDIIPSAEAFLRVIGEKTRKPVKRISYPAMDLLTRYLWPGNLTELRSCLERVAESLDDQVIRAGDLPPSVQTAESTETESSLSLGDAVTRFEKEMLVDALVKAGGNMLKAAKDLKTSYRIVNYKVKKYGIDPHRFAVRRRI